MCHLVRYLSFVLSPAVVTVPGTDWVEPTLLWLTISMPTGSRKTTIYQFLRRLLQEIRDKAQCSGKVQYYRDDTNTEDITSCIYLSGDIVLVRVTGGVNAMYCLVYFVVSSSSKCCACGNIKDRIRTRL